MNTDLWHFHRTALAIQILNMFETGLSSALIFFAPRRMGKTEFLRKDILPMAKEQAWEVIYFSFLGINTNIETQFVEALQKNQKLLPTSRTGKLLKKINKISGTAAGLHAQLEFKDEHEIQKSVIDVLSKLAEHHKILLLLDEVQVLAQHNMNENFIATLRTALDINKDKIKVIFTGSSQEGLRQMFSQAKAPFFHFGQNIPFPE